MSEPTLGSRLVERLDLLKSVARLATYGRYMLPKSNVNPYMLLEQRATRQPGDLAIAYEDDRYTWSQLAEEVGRYADFFAREGIKQGDVVALVMENRPDYVFAVMGLNRLGATSSLINTNLSGRALVHAIRVCNASRILVGEECLAVVEDVKEEIDQLSFDKHVFVRSEGGNEASPPESGARVIDEDLAAASAAAAPRAANVNNSDVFCYIYTSGTTGLPKAAIIRGQRMLAANLTFGHMMHRAGPGDVIYVALPLYHSSGMFLGWGAALATGAAIAIRRKFSASAFVDDLRRFDATSFLYIGELCRYLLARPEGADDRNHRVRVAVGNGMRPDIWEAFQDRFGIPVIREFYGSTEGNVPAANIEGRPGMVGKLPRGQAIVRCDLTTGEVIRNAEGRCEPIEPGEVGLLLGRISKVLSFDGYVDREATNKKVLEGVFKTGDQYFDTSDLIELHEGRWISFADRAGDTFRWKGENVSTNEVAEIIDACPGVEEANVYGVLVPNTDGRAGMAAIRTTDEFDLEVLTDLVGRDLAGYQRPLFLRLLQSEMRLTGTFKHQKVEYRDEAFDLSRISDPLYVLVGRRYRVLDEETLARIEKGEIVLG
jgi:acyl-CoA synthetase (AMP-forming)/AMP-acid ligase II